MGFLAESIIVLLTHTLLQNNVLKADTVRSITKLTIQIEYFYVRFQKLIWLQRDVIKS